MLHKIRNLALFGLGCLLAAALLIVLVGLPYARAYGLVHPARVSINRAPADLGLPYEDIQLTTSDGLTLTAWYIPPRNGVVVICAHGLGGNRAQFLAEAIFLHQNKYGVLLLDLRNHGESEGNVTTLGLYETKDVAAAVEYIGQREQANTAIAAFGHSMGAATVLMAAAQLPEIDAVIAVSPFTSVEDNVSEGMRTLTGLDPRFFAPLVLFFGQREAGVAISAVRPVNVIARISPRPVLLIHGAKDETIPVRNSYALYEAARDPKELVVYEGVGHGGFVFQEPKQYPQTVLNFLEYLLELSDRTR
ncbi:MAG: alpha/beta hydrolase [Anaerolineales bacterium]